MKSIREVRKTIQWRDLLALSKWQVAYNLILPYPFLLLSWWCASQSHFILATICSYFYFASSFRQVHDCIHQSLGVSKRMSNWLLYLLSGVLLSSMHSVRLTHLAHHRNPLDDSDVEGHLHKLTGWQAFIMGAGFSSKLQFHGWKVANTANRIKIGLDLVTIAMVIMLVGFINPDVMLFHIAMMALANVFVGYMAGWSVHHDCDPNGVFARTERNSLINALTFNLLLHVEHHLFPAVPSNHLPILAKRLDKQVPEWTSKLVLPKIEKNDKTCPIRSRFA